MPDRLEALLTTVFGAAGPDSVLEAPGRVNLMGDHIDYLGFDVLPVALAQRVRMFARARRDGRVRLASTTRSTDTVTFDAHANVPAAPAGHWSNYVRGAVQGLFEPGRINGFDGVVDSDLPEAAGLSSSSALVVAAGLAYLHANGETMDPLELAERLARAERYVGTQGGGMDPAVCLLARAGTASRIGFEPLRVAHVTIPTSWRFLVADSLEHAEKSAAARETYNRRAWQARDALSRVRAHVTRGTTGAGNEARGGNAALSVVASVGTSVRAASEKGMPPNGAPALLASIGADELLAVGSRVLDAEALRRFRHVIREADRVLRGSTALAAGEATVFGHLMNASHDSLREDFEVSTPSLDALAGVLRDAGALGARLTGAGLGGSVVALCPAHGIEAILDAVDRTYYRVRNASEPSVRERFIVVPSDGARASAFTSRLT